MRGVRDGTHGASVASEAHEGAARSHATDDEALALLTDIRDSLRRVEARLDQASRGA
jgi:hypothetical protein